MAGTGSGAGVVVELVDARVPGVALAIDAVLAGAFGVETMSDSLVRAVAHGDALAVVHDGGVIVGTGRAVAYRSGGFGWIGLIATAASAQRRGIGGAMTARLVDELAAQGCAAVLDATVAGAPVYERLGFADHGATAVMQLDLSAHDAGAARVGAPMRATDLDEVAAFDAERFGGDRGALLESAFQQRADRSVVVRTADGVVAGYLMATADALGPLVADGDDALRALVAGAARLPWRAPARLYVPPDSGHLGTLVSLGGEVLRTLRHMRRGIGALPGRRHAVAAMLSAGEG